MISIEEYNKVVDENNKLKEAMIFDGEKFYLFDLTVLPVSDMAAIINKNNNIITHDFKNVYKCFKREGYDVKCLFDTYIGGYVLNPSDPDMMQLGNILSSGDGPVGKKLDFLVQEMNREANTIGSKSNDLEITSLMLETKSEIEKIREQVQNIE